MRVEQVDFVSVPTRDVQRSLASTARSSASPRASTARRAGSAERHFLVLESRSRRRPFRANTAGIALRVADVEAAVEEFRAAGGEVIGVEDSGVATWASSRIRKATCSSSTAATRRRRSVARAELLERYRVADADDDGRVVALHRPRRLRSGRLCPERPCPGPGPGTMLEIDVAGLATVGASVEIERAPENSVRAPRRVASSARELVGSDESSPPRTRPAGSTGCWCTCRRASSWSSRSTCA